MKYPFAFNLQPPRSRLLCSADDDFDDDGDGGGEPAEKLFTQADVDRIVGERIGKLKRGGGKQRQAQPSQGSERSYTLAEIREMQELFGGVAPTGKQRPNVNLAAVGPAGASRELESVTNIHDLTDDERKALGPKKVREIYDRQSRSGPGASPFIRKSK